MKSILVVTPFDHIAGGVETVTEILITTLREQGYTVDKLTTDGLGPEGVLERVLTKILGTPYLTAKAFKKMNKDQYSFVICNGEFGWGISHPGAFIYFHGSYLGLRNYSSSLSWKNFLSLSWRAFLQKHAASGKKVIAVSEFLSNILREQGIKTDYVIHNPIDTEKYKPRAIISKNDYLFVGRYDYFAKGFDILEKLSLRYNISICSFGDKAKNSLNYLSCPTGKLDDLYPQYKMLMFPSRFESFGMVPAEAMSSGLPVLVHPVGIGAQLKKDIPQFVVDNFLDERVLRNKIEEITKNYSHYSELARAYAIKNYSLDKYKTEWKNILNA